MDETERLQGGLSQGQAPSLTIEDAVALLLLWRSLAQEHLPQKSLFQLLTENMCSLE